MSGNTDDLAAQLLAAAIKEGRQEYIDALSLLIPVSKLLTTLQTKIEEFDDDWKKKLFRKEYSSADIRFMFDERVLRSDKFKQFLVEAANQVTDVKSRFSIIENMIESGMYDHAKECADLLEDKTDFADHMEGRIKYYARLYEDPYAKTTGEPKKFSRTAALLFNELNLETPTTFTGEYEGKAERKWSKTRFDACVDWVSDLTQGTPTIKVGASGDLEIANSEIVKAFREERQRIREMGVWHNEIFPKYVPVAAPFYLEAEMTKAGGILIEPSFGSVTKTDRGHMENHASHGFKSVSDQISGEDIAIAMTLLPYEEITKIRAAGYEGKIFLIPADSPLKAAEAHPTRPELSIAMRYHRPEFLKPLHPSAMIDFRVAFMDTRAYLRGMDATDPSERVLDITADILDNERYLDAFNSPVEIGLLKQLFVPKDDHSAPRAVLRQANDGRSIEEQASTAARLYKKLIDKIGDTPSTRFSGTEEFIRAVAAEFFDKKLPVQEYNITSFIVDGQHGRQHTPEQERLSAQLGYVASFELRGLPAEELLAKGVRIKDKNVITKICGVLDRLPVPEVASLAKTPSQRAFVLEHFDVKAHYAELPKAIRMMVGGKILENDLGM